MASTVSAEDILRVIANLGARAVLGAPASSVLGRVGFGASTASLGDVKSAAREGTDAATRSRTVASEYPNVRHTVEVVQATLDDKGHSEHNAHLEPETAKQAARMQTLQEHNEALTQFLRSGMTPSQRAQALQAGADAEENLLSFWADRAPRKSYTPSSSAIAAIRLSPDHRVQVAWRSNPGKWYSYRPAVNQYEASKIMQELVTSPSIGRTLMRHAKGVPEDGVGSFGDWARAHYDPSFGT